jgi:hypothetical protein
VLIGATLIPAWNKNVGSLPIHFAASGTSAAASILELAGNRSEALNKIGIGATALETVMGASLELNRAPEAEPLKNGGSGLAMRTAGVLSGPLPLALRLLSLKRSSGSTALRRSAAICSVLGSLLTRWAWIEGGKNSAMDARIPLGLGGTVVNDSL